MKRVLLAVGFLIAWAPRAEPHQLDEYLQATRLGISPDRLDVEIDLTPGVSVASRIFALVDGDGDGRVAPGEIEAYARRVVADLVLRVDDRPYALTLVRAESPSWAEISDGTGRIRVEAVADVPLRTRGRHHIFYENQHRSANDIYLVNALKPLSSRIEVVAQRRDTLQHSIAVDVVVRTTLDSFIWVGLPCSGFAALLLARRRSARRRCCNAGTSVG
jgi:hypothetical protein